MDVRAAISVRAGPLLVQAGLHVGVGLTLQGGLQCRVFINSGTHYSKGFPSRRPAHIL